MFVEIKFFLAPVLHRLMHNLVFFSLSFSINKSSAVLAQHLTWWGADSSGWQIRDPSARKFIRVSSVCCSCLSGSCLLRWLSNPQALLTQSCVSHWYRSEQVQRRWMPLLCFVKLPQGEENVSTPVVWNCLDIPVVMWNISFCTLTNSKIPPSFD